MFEIDDVVVCENNKRFKFELSVGTLYTIVSKNSGTVHDCVICRKEHGEDVKVDNDVDFKYASCRFRKATEREDFLYRVCGLKNIGEIDNVQKENNNEGRGINKKE